MISLKTDLQAVESMLYFWDACKDKERVNERFLNDFAALPAMTMIYTEDFNAESVRYVLSGVTNREPIRPATKAAGRFFNNNLWMLEDLSLTHEMAQPIKVLNLNDVADQLSAEFEGVDRSITVYFAPLHLEESYIKADALIINFFRLQPDFAGGVAIAGQPVEDYIAAKVREMMA